MDTKISPEEIQQMRENAEKERALHQEIMQDINRMYSMSEAQQMEIVRRQKEKEVGALLCSNHLIYEAAQLYIYDDQNNLPKAKEYMLKYVKLVLAVEKKMFDDDVQIYWPEEESLCNQRQFSPMGEKYMVEQTLAKCEKCNKITTELTFLNMYVHNYKLSPVGDVALIKSLSIIDSDSKMDALERFIIDYLAQHEDLSYFAELELIKSGNHRVIMHYLQHSAHLISNPEVVDALLRRANREEVETYFNRYAEEV